MRYGQPSRSACAVGGVPHFHPKDKPCAIRLTETGSTHPYSEKARELIDHGRLVLDFGAGVQTPERLRPHVVNLDAIHFPYVDVVNTCRETIAAGVYVLARKPV